MQQLYRATTNARRSFSSGAGHVVFSGIQPTGVPHLGNYLGAMKHWLKLQNTASPRDSLIFSIVGLHSITVPRSPSTLAKDRRDMLASLLAAGIDPQRCTLFHQEQVPEHTELSWILGCLVPVGLLQRMTSWKAKLFLLQQSSPDNSEGQLHLGLLSYPVLQAADILLYNTTHVPVGEDQRQHVELTRDIAKLFNSQYDKTFTLPEFTSTPHAKILSLRNPSQKMSKSDPQPKSRIMLTDTPSDITSKITSAVTDSEREITYDPVARPGVSNLIDIIMGMQGNTEDNMSHEEAAADIAMHFSSSAELKQAADHAVQSKLYTVRAELERLQGDQGYLEKIEREGALKAREIAARTINRVRKSVGF